LNKFKLKRQQQTKSGGGAIQTAIEKMIKNLNKRKELAQMVYNRYGDQFGNLTKEDKKDLEMEIGAAFEGYEMALKEVAKMIAESKNITDIMQFITEVTGA
jgi:hypothetical protein